MEALGRQLLLEYYECSPERLDDTDALRELLVRAAEAMRATVVSAHTHHFSPHGVSGVVIISESHLTIHTWPEYGYAAIDIFTCGNVIDPWDAHPLFLKGLEAGRSSATELRRGLLDVPRGTLPEAYNVTPDDET